MTQDEPIHELVDPAAFERWVRIEKVVGRIAMLIVPVAAVGVPIIAAQTGDTTLLLFAQILMFAIIVPAQFLLWRETQSARVRARLLRVQSANTRRLALVNGFLAVIWFALALTTWGGEIAVLGTVGSGALAGLSWWRSGQARLQGR